MKVFLDDERGCPPGWVSARWPADAIRLLETESLSSSSRAPWVPRLRYAYADALLAAGRREDAVEWFHRTVAADGDHSTDAAERLAELE